MQILFEAWLKDIILERTKVRSRFGWKYLSHIEDVNGVVATFVDIYGLEHTVRSKYLVGCDGGSSRVRKTAGIKMIGGQMYVYANKKLMIDADMRIPDQPGSISSTFGLKNLLRSSHSDVPGTLSQFIPDF